MVVLPDDSGPKISEMRPRGKPPIPSAASTEIEPVEMVGTACTVCAPRRMIEPFPNCFSIWPSVAPRARLRSFSSMGKGPSSRGELHYKTYSLRLVAVVIGHLAGREEVRVRGRRLRKHGRVPSFVFGNQPAIQLGLPILQIRALQRIG